MNEFTTTLEKLKPILVEALGSAMGSLIKPEAHFGDDLGADSLDGIEITMAVEEEFDIEIDDDDLAQISTVADLVTLVDRKLAGNAVPA